MNILWIIGNGFDVNLKLKTSYQDFYNLSYSTNPRTEGHRKLIKEAYYPDGSGMEEIKWWSDLETLLGISTELYDNSKASLFHDTYESMQGLLTAHLEKEDRSFANRDISNLDTEFWNSVTRFNERLAGPSQNKLPDFRNAPETIGYEFMSLNYTRVLDRLLEQARKLHQPFDLREVPPNPYPEEDIAMPVFHIHGALESHDVVFGVSDQSQIRNDDYVKNGDFLELWRKQNKNAFYGNDNTGRMKALVREADIICIYGCSLGATDKYIWSAICNKMMNDISFRLIVFEHSIEPFEDSIGYRYQTARNDIANRLAQAGAWDHQQASIYRDRIIVQSSKKIFRFN